MRPVEDRDPNDGGGVCGWQGQEEIGTPLLEEGAWRWTDGSAGHDGADLEGLWERMKASPPSLQHLPGFSPVVVRSEGLAQRTGGGGRTAGLWRPEGGDVSLLTLWVRARAPCLLCLPL